MESRYYSTFNILLFNSHLFSWALQKFCNSSLAQSLRSTKEVEDKRQLHFCLHRFLKRRRLPSGWKSDKTSQEGLGPSAKLNNCVETKRKLNQPTGINYGGWLGETMTKRSSVLYLVFQHEVSCQIYPKLHFQALLRASPGIFCRSHRRGEMARDNFVTP